MCKIIIKNLSFLILFIFVNPIYGIDNTEELIKLLRTAPGYSPKTDAFLKERVTDVVLKEKVIDAYPTSDYKFGYYFPNNSDQPKEPKEPKEPVKEANPLKTILTGPDQKEIGKLVMISAKGTIADFVKFDCIPDNSDWQVIKLVNDNDYGIIFSTDKPGNYVFLLIGTDKNGNISLAKHSVSIINSTNGKPKPNPEPRPITIIDINQLQSAYSTDLAAGVGNANQKTVLANIFTQSANIVNDPSLTKPSQIYDAMRQVSAKVLPSGSLPQTRKVLADAEKLYLNINATAPLDQNLRKKMSDLFSQIGAALNSLKDN